VNIEIPYGEIFWHFLNTTTFKGKTGMEIVDSLVRDVHILKHPIRSRIVELLAEKPHYINEIVKALGEERRLTTYHLSILEQYGFLSSKYEISEEGKSKGRALRKYWIKSKVEDVISELKKEL
jgi:DNA-binding transcriptional ArsR family regulator